MELGMIGLGRMGGNMVRRLLSAGHRCVAYDRHPEPVQALARDGAVGATSLEDLVGKLTPPASLRLSPLISLRVTSSSTVATPITPTTFAGRRSWRPGRSTTSMSVPVGVSGVLSGATVS